MKTKTQCSKIWFWLQTLDYILYQVYFGNWKHYNDKEELIYEGINSAAIALCMSYAGHCRNNFNEILFMLEQSNLRTIAGSSWDDSILVDIVECARFVRMVLQSTALEVLFVFYLYPGVKMINDLCSLTGLNSKTVEHILVTLQSKGCIVKVARGTYMLVGNSKVIYYCSLLLSVKHLSNNLCCLLDRYEKTGGFKLSLDNDGCFTLDKTHPHYYPWLATPARQKIFISAACQQAYEKFFTPQTKGVQHVMLKTSNQPATVQAHPLEVWGPINYDIGAFLEDVLEAPQGTREGFASPVRVRCPNPKHIDTSPSCSVFPQGNAYCHGCHRKWKDLEAIVASMVEGTYEEGTVEELEATMDVLYPYIIGGGLIDKNTVTYQKIASHTTARKEVNKYELEDAIQHYAGNFAGSYFSHNWTDMSTYSAGQWEMINLGFKPETLAAWHVYSFDVDPWFKVRIPLLAGGTQIVGEQALSTRHDRKRGAMKYFTSPGLEKSAHVYGPLDNSSTLLLVEGKKDAMMVWQRGWHNVGTTLGATLSDQQADFIAHKYKTVLMGYDNDKAGELGYQQAYQKLVARGVHVEKIFYHSNDPASATINDWRLGVISACSNAGCFCPAEVWDYKAAV